MIDGGEIRQDRFDQSGSENNDFDSATDLGRLGYRAETNLTIHAAENEDYYSFVAEAGGTVKVDLRFDQYQGDVDVFLYDSGHNLVASLEGWYIDDVKVESLGRYDVHAVIGEEITDRDFGVRQFAFGTGDQTPEVFRVTCSRIQTKTKSGILEKPYGRVSESGCSSTKTAMARTSWKPPS